MDSPVPSYVAILIVFARTQMISSSLMSGDVIIAGLLDIYTSMNGGCASINPLSVKHHEAIKWTLRQLNDQNYIPGVKLGLQTWPTCNLVPTSNDRTIDLINKIRDDKQDATFSTPPLVGLVGPEHSSEASNTSLLLSSQRLTDRLVQIGFSTTAASLSDRTMYPNFYRVVPNDQIQIEVMISLLRKLEWNYIVVIYDLDTYGIGLYNSFKARAREENICIKSGFGVEIGENNAVSSSSMRNFLDKTTELHVTGVIVFSTAAHINVLLKAAQAMKAVNSDQISFVFSEGIDLSKDAMKDLNGAVYSTAKGSYITAPQMISVVEFETYWKTTFQNVSRLIEESNTNTWLKEVFTIYSKDNCVPSNDSYNPGCDELEQSKLDELSEESLYTSYAIQATYIMAKLIKDAHSIKCPGANGMCNNLRNVLYTEKGYLLDRIREFSVHFRTDFSFIQSELSNVSFSFDHSNGPNNETGYDVYHYRKCIHDDSLFCFEKIGYHEKTFLQVNTELIRDYHGSSAGKSWPDVNRAQCPEGRTCSSCIIEDISESIFYRDGDVLVCGIIPIHNKDSKDPLKCGDIRTELSVEIAEALVYAVSMINQKEGRYSNFFRGQTIGFVFMDSCNQKLSLQRKLLELVHKGILLKDGTYAPFLEKLLGCVGAYGSSISAASADILGPLGISQIAYASTAALLSDRTNYPYFMRTCTPDDKQAKAMIKIIQQLKSNFIQVVYSEGTYGEGGRDAIRNEARLAKICIRNEIMVEEGEVFEAIIEKLRQNSFAKIVILFLRSHIVDSVTTALNSQMDTGEFMFIGSEAWGYRPVQFQAKKKLVGSITLALQMADNANFTSYLNNLNIHSYTEDPWIKAYAEKKFNCHFSTSFEKSSDNKCNQDTRLANSNSYQQDIWTPFALNAMLALLSATNTAFKRICGENANSLCAEYRQNPTTLRDILLQEEYDVFDDGSPIRLFDENGDGNVGYKIYNIQRSKVDANVLIYSQVGQSPLDENNFRFETESVVSPDQLSLPSVCPNPKTCLECFPAEEQKPNDGQGITDEDTTKTAILGSLVGILSLIVIVLIGLYTYNRCRRYEEPDGPYLDPTNDPYLYPCNRDNQYITDISTAANPNSSDDSGVADTNT